MSETDLSFDLATPTEMGGDGKGYNPEQLFAAGYSACYIGAMKFAASQPLAKLRLILSRFWPKLKKEFVLLIVY